MERSDPPLIHPLAPRHCSSALSTSPICSGHPQRVGGPWAILDTPALHLLHAHAQGLRFHEWPFPRLHSPYLGRTPGNGTSQPNFPKGYPPLPPAFPLLPLCLAAFQEGCTQTTSDVWSTSEACSLTCHIWPVTFHPPPPPRVHSPTSLYHIHAPLLP